MTKSNALIVSEIIEEIQLTEQNSIIKRRLRAEIEQHSVLLKRCQEKSILIQKKIDQIRKELIRLRTSLRIKEALLRTL